MPASPGDSGRPKINGVFGISLPAVDAGGSAREVRTGGLR
jgi:hypothetical protein